MSDRALLAVIDAVAWLRSALSGREPLVDLCETLGKLSPEELEDVARDARVEGSRVLQQLVGLEHVARRRRQPMLWKYVSAEVGGPIRVDLRVPLQPPKMIVLRA